MPVPPFRLPLRALLLVAVIAAVVIGAIGADHPSDYIVEHVLTAATIIGLLALEWRDGGGGPLSNHAYLLIFAFLLLHVLGSHYTYSRVPYDDWARTIVGRDISSLVGSLSYEQSGQPRNHFDRLVHFCFGLLLTMPSADLLARWLGLDVKQRWKSVIAAVVLLCSLGAIYEIAEWLYAEVAGQEAAEHYNGQQGDAFDAHKDMALNLVGSVMATALMAVAARLTMWFDSSSASARFTTR